MKAVLFDFGGTIDTDGVHWSERFWEYYVQFGIDVAKKEFEKAFVQSDRDILANNLSQASFRQILELQVASQFEILGLHDEEIRRRLVDSCYGDTCIVIAAANVLLKQIGEHYALGLVSNFYGNLDVVCREFGLDTVFDTTVDSEIAGVRKPDPAIFRIALERLKAEAAESFVVGDSYDRDIVPGKCLGCKTIWLKGKSWKEEPRNEAADFIIGKFDELRKFFVSQI